MNKTDAQNSFQHRKLVLQKFFNRFYNKKRYSSYDDDLINDVVLIKEILPQE